MLPDRPICTSGHDPVSMRIVSYGSCFVCPECGHKIEFCDIPKSYKAPRAPKFREQGPTK